MAEAAGSRAHRLPTAHAPASPPDNCPFNTRSTPMEMETLRDLYVEELKDLYSAENQILKALPRMIKAATHPQLKKAFAKHEKQTQQQVKRLERIAKMLDENPTGKKCHGMEGLIEEAKELM